MNLKKVEFFGFYFYFYENYSTLLRLPPLRFHCVKVCWESGIKPRTVAALALTALTTRLDLTHMNLIQNPWNQCQLTQAEQLTVFLPRGLSPLGFLS
jgi:hypothetical protein